MCSHDQICRSLLGTQVAELSPLATCRSLRFLNCVGTKVVDVGPLVSCTSLRGTLLTVGNSLHTPYKATLGPWGTLTCTWMDTAMHLPQDWAKLAMYRYVWRWVVSRC